MKLTHIETKAVQLFEAEDGNIYRRESHFNASDELVKVEWGMLIHARPTVHADKMEEFYRDQYYPKEHGETFKEEED